MHAVAKFGFHNDIMDGVRGGSIETNTDHGKAIPVYRGVRLGIPCSDESVLSFESRANECELQNPKMYHGHVETTAFFERLRSFFWTTFFAIGSCSAGTVSTTPISLVPRNLYLNN